MKMYKEVVYLTGNTPQKKRVFYGDNAAVAKAANDEVSVVCRFSGCYYYVVGSHPFSDFTVYQYLSYQRSLKGGQLTKAAARELLKKVGLKVPLYMPLKRLDYLTRRLVTLATAISESTTTLAINLDGVPYSISLNRRLKEVVKFFTRKYSVYISVTDSRLIPSAVKKIQFHSKAFNSAAVPSLRSSVVKRTSLLNAFKTFGTPSPSVIEKGLIVKLVKKS